MYEIKVTDKPLKISEGVIKLSDSEAADRVGQVRKKGKAKGFFEIIRPVTFKVGQTFLFDGNIKLLRAGLEIEEILTDEERKIRAAGEEAKKKAEAEARKKAETERK